MLIGYVSWSYLNLFLTDRQKSLNICGQRSDFSDGTRTIAAPNGITQKDWSDLPWNIFGFY